MAGFNLGFTANQKMRLHKLGRSYTGGGSTDVFDRFPRAPKAKEVIGSPVKFLTYLRPQQAQEMLSENDYQKYRRLILKGVK